MPKQYVAMRDKFIRSGMSKPAAQEKAAKIYNARHPVPVTRSSDKKK